LQGCTLRSLRISDFYLMAKVLYNRSDYKTGTTGIVYKKGFFKQELQGLYIRKDYKKNHQVQGLYNQDGLERGYARF